MTLAARIFTDLDAERKGWGWGGGQPRSGWGKFSVRVILCQCRGGVPAPGAGGGLAGPGLTTLGLRWPKAAMLALSSDNAYYVICAFQ